MWSCLTTRLESSKLKLIKIVGFEVCNVKEARYKKEFDFTIPFFAYLFVSSACFKMYFFTLEISSSSLFTLMNLFILILSVMAQSFKILSANNLLNCKHHLNTNQLYRSKYNYEIFWSVLMK